MPPRVIRPPVLMHLEGDWGYMVWSRSHQSCFIQELLFARKFVPLHCPAVEEPVLHVICTILTNRYDHPYNLAFLKELFGKLKERFELFRYVLGFPHVEYDQAMNLMSMPGDTEAALRYIRPRSSRYIVKGEPLWDDLNFMFEVPEDFVNDTRVVHPHNKIEMIDIDMLPNCVKDEDDGGQRIPVYCGVFNEIYRSA